MRAIVVLALCVVSSAIGVNRSEAADPPSELSLIMMHDAMSAVRKAYNRTRHRRQKPRDPVRDLPRAQQQAVREAKAKLLFHAYPASRPPGERTISVNDTIVNQISPVDPSLITTKEVLEAVLGGIKGAEQKAAQENRLINESGAPQQPVWNQVAANDLSIMAGIADQITAFSEAFNARSGEQELKTVSSIPNGPQIPSRYSRSTFSVLEEVIGRTRVWGVRMGNAAPNADPLKTDYQDASGRNAFFWNGYSPATTLGPALDAVADSYNTRAQGVQSKTKLPSIPNGLEWQAFEVIQDAHVAFAATAPVNTPETVKFVQDVDLKEFLKINLFHLGDTPTEGGNDDDDDDDDDDDNDDNGKARAAR